MAIELICKGCTKQLRVRDEDAGKQARCPECGTVMPIPGGAATMPMPSSSAPGVGASTSAPLPSQTAPTTPFASSSERWLMATPDGRRYGPVSKPDLDSWVREGRVAPGFRLQREGAAEWQMAEAVYPQLARTMAGAAGAVNPHADFNAAASVGGANPIPFTPRPTYQKPHRGGVILGLSIAGLVCGCGLLGAIAWIMATQDLREMKAGVMDPEGQGMTQAGLVVGIISTVIMLLSIAGIILSNIV